MQVCQKSARLVQPLNNRFSPPARRAFLFCCPTMPSAVLTGAVAAVITTLGLSGNQSPRERTHSRGWEDKALPPRDRALKLVAAMNLTERLVLLHGAAGDGIGNTAAIPRLGIPSFKLEDGPSGVRLPCRCSTVYAQALGRTLCCFRRGLPGCVKPCTTALLTVHCPS